MIRSVFSRLVNDYGWRTTENKHMVVTNRNGLYHDQVVCCEFYEGEFIIHTGNVYLGSLDAEQYSKMKAAENAKLLHEAMEERFAEHYSNPANFTGKLLGLAA